MLIVIISTIIVLILVSIIIIIKSMSNNNPLDQGALQGARGHVVGQFVQDTYMMCAYIHVYVCIYVYIYIYMYNIYVYTSLSLSLSISLSLSLYIHMYIYICVQDTVHVEENGHHLGGTTCLTPLVEYGLDCFVRVSSRRGSPELAIFLATYEESLLCVCIYIYIYICIYVYTYIYIYICMYCTYIYIYMFDLFVLDKWCQTSGAPRTMAADPPTTPRGHFEPELLAEI